MSLLAHFHNFTIRSYIHFKSCNESRMFSWNSTWYPETHIGDCCSLDYDANITQLEIKLHQMYDMKHGNALDAIKNGFLDFLQGIRRHISGYIQNEKISLTRYKI